MYLTSNASQDSEVIFVVFSMKINMFSTIYDIMAILKCILAIIFSYNHIRYNLFSTLTVFFTALFVILHFILTAAAQIKINLIVFSLFSFHSPATVLTKTININKAQKEQSVSQTERETICS